MSCVFCHPQSTTGAFLLPGVVLALPSGVAGRYASDRLIVTTGLIFLALGGVVAVIATNFNMFGLARIICGFGFVLTTIFITKMVADWFAGRELVLAMAIVLASWPIGIGTALGTQGALADLLHQHQRQPCGPLVQHSAAASTSAG